MMLVLGGDQVELVSVGRANMPTGVARVKPRMR